MHIAMRLIVHRHIVTICSLHNVSLCTYHSDVSAFVCARRRGTWFYVFACLVVLYSGVLRVCVLMLGVVLAECTDEENT